MKKTNTGLQEMVARAQRRQSLPTPIECRLIRMRARLSQAEIAEVIGTSAAAVSRYENVRRHPRGIIFDRYLSVIESLTHAKPTA